MPEVLEEPKVPHPSKPGLHQQLTDRPVMPADGMDRRHHGTAATQQGTELDEKEDDQHNDTLVQEAHMVPPKHVRVTMINWCPKQGCKHRR